MQINGQERLVCRVPFAKSAVLVTAGLLILAIGCARLTTTKTVPQAPPLQPGESTLAIVSSGELKELEDRADGLAHFAAGVHKELAGDAPEATEHFRQAASSDPANEQLALEVARRLLREQKAAEALALLEKAISQNQNSGGLHAWLALAYLQSGETNRAIEACQSAIAKAPDNLPAYQNLAQIYIAAGRTNDATAILDKAISQKNAPVEFHLALAELLSRYNRQQIISDEAGRAKILETLDNAAAQKPENPIFQQRIGDLYLLFGEPAKAEPFYVELLKEFPEAPGVRERLANIYLRTDKKEKAAELLESIRRDKPTDPQNYYFLGSIAFDGKDFSKAAEYYETAIKLNPDFEPVYYDLAGVNIARQKPEDALTVLNKARDRFPQLNFTLEFYTGVAMGQMEKFSEALPHLISAELLGKTTEPARLNHIFYYQLGSTYERMGNIPEAVKCFRKSLEIAPDYADAMNYLGYMWAERGENLEEAKGLIERAVELEPGNAAFLDSLGWVLFKLKRPQEALTHMNKAIAATEKPDPTLYDHLGDIHAELKQLDQARAAYTKSLEAEPSDSIQKKLDSLAP